MRIALGLVLAGCAAEQSSSASLSGDPHIVTLDQSSPAIDIEHGLVGASGDITLTGGMLTGKLAANNNATSLSDITLPPSGALVDQLAPVSGSSFIVFPSDNCPAAVRVISFDNQATTLEYDRVDCVGVGVPVFVTQQSPACIPSSHGTYALTATIGAWPEWQALDATTGLLEVPRGTEVRFGVAVSDNGSYAFGGACAGTDCAITPVDDTTTVKLSVDVGASCD